MRFNRMVARGVVFAMVTSGAGQLSLAGLALGGPALVASAAEAATAKRTAAGLLADVRASLAMMAMSYKDRGGRARHRSATEVLAAIGQAAKAAQSLEGALAARDATATSRATARLSSAIGDLQTRYALSAARNARASQGLRALNASWKAYAKSFVLPPPAKGTRSARADEMRALRTKVGDLSRRVADLEAEVAGNAALHGEVARIRRDLVFYDTRPYDEANYQTTLLMLTFVSGSLDALAVTTKVYYPTYAIYFQTPLYTPDVWTSYWDGYYDGYYDGRDQAWYDRPVVIDASVTEITQIEIYQTINYETIFDVADETSSLYGALPVEDLSAVEVPPLSDELRLDGALQEGSGPEATDPAPAAASAPEAGAPAMDPIPDEEPPIEDDLVPRDAGEDRSAEPAQAEPDATDDTSSEPMAEPPSRIEAQPQPDEPPMREEVQPDEAPMPEEAQPVHEEAQPEEPPVREEAQPEREPEPEPEPAAPPVESDAPDCAGDPDGCASQ